MDWTTRIEELERKIKSLENQVAELRSEKEGQRHEPFGKSTNIVAENRIDQSAGHPVAPPFEPHSELRHEPHSELRREPHSELRHGSHSELRHEPHSELRHGSHSELRHEPHSEPPLAPHHKPTRDWEHLIAKVWLPRIFIIVLLLGVLWGFSAAVNAGIITRPVRCVLGILVSGWMFWQGERQIRHSRYALGQVLLGGSIAVLMLSLFAAHALYGFIPPYLAFILYVLSIGAGIFAAVRHRSQALMIIAMAAGYLAPFLVVTEQPNIRIFTAYEALFSIAMISLSFRYAYRAALYTAFGVLHFSLLVGYIIADWETDPVPFLIAVSLQHLALFAFSAFRHHRMKTDQTIVLFTGFSLTAAWTYGLFAGDQEAVYPAMLAIGSFIYSIAAFLAMKRPKAAVYFSIATLGWFLWLADALDASALSSAMLVEGALALILGMKLNSKLQQVTGGCVYLIGVFHLLFYPIPKVLSAETLAWLALFATMGGLYVFARKGSEQNAWYKPYRPLLIWAESILFLIFITQITNLLTEPFTYDLQHLILSAVWVIYAIAVITLGIAANKRKARLAGIAFLFVILLKIILIDLPGVSVAIRAILFIGLGGVGVGVSRLFYRRKS